MAISIELSNDAVVVPPASPARFLWEHPATVFAIIALVFGFILVFLNPPFAVPDEQTHFYRAFQVSEGGWRSTITGKVVGGALPASIPRMFAAIRPEATFHRLLKQDFRPVQQAWHTPLQAHVRSVTAFPNTALYSPLAYLPQALGILVGRVLGDSPLLLFYAGRIGNLLVWIVLMVLAIRLLPFGKWLYATLGLLPMSLSQAASLSADGVTNGLAALFLAYALALTRRQDKPVRLPQICLLVVLAFALGMLKGVYLLVVVAVLCIPPRRFASLRAYGAAMAVVLGASLVSWFGWYHLTSNIMPLYPFADQVRPHDQLQLLLHTPTKGVAVIMETLRVLGKYDMKTFFGVLGWLDTALPLDVYPCLMLTLLLATVAGSLQRVLIAWWQRLLMVAIFLISFVGIYLLEYLCWTPINYPYVLGIQGRYFLAFAPLLLFAFIPNRALPRRIETVLGFLFPLCYLGVLAVTCVTVYQRYY